jgi:broad specificity phosphatase PhoE
MYVEKVLYLCRHGETESNVKQTVQGWEEPLNLQGTFQAHRLAARLAETSLAAEIPIQKIYCSSMLRALQTANLISVPLGLVPTPTRYLAEVMHPTNLQGVSGTGPAFLAYAKERARVFAEGNVQISDEETFAMAHARAKKVLRFLLDGPEQRFSARARCLVIAPLRKSSTAPIRAICAAGKKAGMCGRAIPATLQNDVNIALCAVPLEVLRFFLHFNTDASIMRA